MLGGMRPIRIVGGAAASGAFRLELNQKDIARGRKLLDKYQGAPLMVRMQKATLAAARTLEAPMRAATPKGPGRPAQDGSRGGQVRPGRAGGSLRRKTRAQQIGQRVGFRQYVKTVNADVGPRSPHRHLVIRGHRIVTKSGRDTGRRSRANPYVDVVAARFQARAIAEMRRYIFDQRYDRTF